MLWLLVLILSVSGLHFAEALSAYVALSASELRYAIGGGLLGLPIALAISAMEHRAAAVRSRFSRY